MLEQGDLITLNNKKEYIVIKQIVFKGVHYILLIAKDGISEFLICEFKQDKLIPVTATHLISELTNQIKINDINGGIYE